jgi:hypothetical protein
MKLDEIKQNNTFYVELDKTYEDIKRGIYIHMRTILEKDAAIYLSVK